MALEAVEEADQRTRPVPRMTSRRLAEQLTVRVTTADDLIVLRVDASGYRLASALALNSDQARSIGSDLIAAADSVEQLGDTDTSTGGAFRY